jgi:hypothetical protein
MLTTKIFPVRMNIYEKAMLAELAKELHRSQSEVIRLLIRETLIEVKSQSAGENTSKMANNLLDGENHHE